YFHVTGVQTCALPILKHHELTPVIVVSKVDLMTDENLKSLKEDLKFYEPFYDIHYVNSKARIGIDSLDGIFEDKITILAGQTGRSEERRVGKKRYYMR